MVKAQAKQKKAPHKSTHASRIWGPTPAQVAFVDALLTADKAVTITQAAETAGVRRRAPYEWLKDERFREYYSARRAAVAKAWGGLVDKSLISRCLKGDVAAIKLFYERFDDMSLKVEHSGKIEHEHTDAAERIASRLDELAQRRRKKAGAS